MDSSNTLPAIIESNIQDNKEIKSRLIHNEGNYEKLMQELKSLKESVSKSAATTTSSDDLSIESLLHKIVAIEDKATISSLEL